MLRRIAPQVRPIFAMIPVPGTVMFWAGVTGADAVQVAVVIVLFLAGLGGESAGFLNLPLVYESRCQQDSAGNLTFGKTWVGET
jgi:hypothetical protein